ncbi:MAG: site-2 protease family protein [Ferrovibrio sp.]|uniref:site-2 protease family protein n=1 Tax=Ferrovibrio sp. TaxID=1917215 RepID=UPI0026133EDE|nr:site-2 protease family protein [Ferrovibrio sp.]MCW0236422.1 site-2 protease family protein [Ferrovibrio sp.]
MMSVLYTVSTWILPALLAITLHEAAHGFVAWRLGDDTAQRAGRLSLNPLRHVDPMGTVVLPAMLLLVKAPFLFGWAKPVPVDMRNLPSPRRDMALVAAAGPGSNLLQAYIALLLFHLLPLLGDPVGGWVADNLENALQINLVLCVFNMIPVPPLDGGRVAVGLLPLALARPLARLERYGMVMLLILLLAVPWVASQFGIDWNPLFALITPIVNGLAGILLALSGHGG